jgi:hypothetical protein
MSSSEARPERWWQPAVFDELSADQLRSVLAVAWWEPRVAKDLSAKELAAYRALPYWRRRISSLLSAEQRKEYEHQDDLRAADRFPISPTAEELRTTFDDVTSLLEATNQVLASMTVHRREVARLRRELLLAMDLNEVETEAMADALHTSYPRVRQLVTEAARDMGVPVRTAHGGKTRKPTAE